MTSLGFLRGVLGICAQGGGNSLEFYLRGGILRIFGEGKKFTGPLPFCQRGGGLELSGSLPRELPGVCKRCGILCVFSSGGGNCRYFGEVGEIVDVFAMWGQFAR